MSVAYGVRASQPKNAKVGKPPVVGRRFLSFTRGDEAFQVAVGESLTKRCHLRLRSSFRNDRMTFRKPRNDNRNVASHPAISTAPNPPAGGLGLATVKPNAAIATANVR